MDQVTLLNEAFIINKETYQRLSEKGFANKNQDFYELNLFEVLYLLEKKKVTVIEENETLTFQDIKERYPHTHSHYLVYKDLKGKGYTVKSGSKYGFVFRIYEKGITEKDDHALWLIDVNNALDETTFKELLGKNRIAHSTNKKMLLAIVDHDSMITYLETNWKRT